MILFHTHSIYHYYATTPHFVTWIEKTSISYILHGCYVDTGVFDLEALIGFDFTSEIPCCPIRILQ